MDGGAGRLSRLLRQLQPAGRAAQQSLRLYNASSKAPWPRTWARRGPGSQKLGVRAENNEDNSQKRTSLGVSGALTLGGISQKMTNSEMAVSTPCTSGSLVVSIDGLSESIAVSVSLPGL